MSTMTAAQAAGESHEQRIARLTRELAAAHAELVDVKGPQFLRRIDVVTETFRTRAETAERELATEREKHVAERDARIAAERAAITAWGRYATAKAEQDWPHCPECNFPLQDQGTPNGLVCLLCNARSELAAAQAGSREWESKYRALKGGI